MSSNSDSLFFVLSYLKRHPKEIIFATNDYSNVVQIYIYDNFHIADADIYFPANRLMVNKLKEDFLAQHGNLLDYFWEKSGRVLTSYHEVWATTTHLTKRAVYLIELSYE